jgi:beta-glucosidase
MPGQQAGTAVADVLFGDVNPSGRLPVSLPVGENDQGFTPSQYPGINYQSNFTERLLFGYRWYDAHGVEPVFPFGHGLSYTSFSYGPVTSDAKVKKVKKKNKSISTTPPPALSYSSSPPSRSPSSLCGKRKKRGGASSSTLAATVSVTVTNSGPVQGAEVAQLYVAFPNLTKGEPLRVLKGFEKVLLDPGQTTALTFDLTEQDLAVWDPDLHNWARVFGEFTAFVGASSRDIRGKAMLNVTAPSSIC